jgi:hypothetical protein
MWILLIFVYTSAVSPNNSMVIGNARAFDSKIECEKFANKYIINDNGYTKDLILTCLEKK